MNKPELVGAVVLGRVLVATTLVVGAADAKPKKFVPSGHHVSRDLIRCERYP